ncbi:hypothetical protein [Commensalibacter sp. A3DC]|uniref:hypothetical protein n=1 Tax=Commensalibacter sp. A3DC TaxID=3093920 RepID=UPI0039B6D75E
MVDLQNTSKFRKSFAAIFGMSAENEDTGENNNSDDTQDGKKASDDGKDDPEENVSNENDPGKNCSDDDGDDESDAEDEKDDEKAKARARERGRCKAILLSPAAKNDLQQAYYLAFGSNLSRRQAINILSMSTKKSPGKQNGSRMSIRNNSKKFNDMMSSHQSRVSQQVPVDNQGNQTNIYKERSLNILKAVQATGLRKVKEGII